ncbi:uncharacterized protein RAG0_03453 [Rhynchosporium agropyri]|uniref:Uncharacterized protein n=1 Tax=Rhynchosporium agropyri TaxID=914238 RepID=A0A1E1K4D2_9HELO|nr:uncharacterized protein RAG0_03453 [Rhynchosporium agropyri]
MFEGYLSGTPKEYQHDLKEDSHSYSNNIPQVNFRPSRQDTVSQRLIGDNSWRSTGLQNNISFSRL